MNHAGSDECTMSSVLAGDRFHDASGHPKRSRRTAGMGSSGNL
jgi:hypothetical protein